MGNGMYCDVESYSTKPTEEERLCLESRKSLKYLKDAHRRLVLLMKKLAHFKRNPLGSAMCKELETKIYQQSLLLKRFHNELNSMVEEYNRMCNRVEEGMVSTQSTLNQTSSQADWEEVIEMAKLPVEAVLARSQPIGGSHHHHHHNSSSSSQNGGSSSSCDSFFKSIYQSPLSGTTAAESVDHSAGITSTAAPAPAPTPAPEASRVAEAKISNAHKSLQKTFPWQMTPPIEDVVELREHLRVLERSPLFTSTHVGKASNTTHTVQPTTTVPQNNKMQQHLGATYHQQYYRSPIQYHKQQQPQQPRQQQQNSSPLRYQQLLAPRRPLYSLP
ncbi:hypothetical protein GGI26_000945 [Coemansia sp. RSA 1358]|uniref:Uncharacterized protein n=1 Tax=Coemansia umbellata TaxID=1424467 RepID=A0ABQ8PTI1_9FUNG|nr:hypothetical protein EDC05_000763 [Coemansia umbellata]KAJ2625142.1 hypothetical protein GGI26_000945 [Coemansia sp. RSA 1358]